MIYIERIITIAKGDASMDEQIVLYKGDKNVEIQFTIKNNPFRQKNGLMPTYGQLVINREAGPIFSEVAQVINNRVIFIVTGDMIDGIEECGNYNFQIRLFNEDKTSRVTLPPIEGGMLIKEPICEEEGVNAATVNYSRTTTEEEAEALDPFDEKGRYNKTIWADGDLITDLKLNKIEDAIYSMKFSMNGHTSEIDDLLDLANYFDDEIIAIKSNYATKEYVNNAIAAIDLTNYATKDDIGNINAILDAINGEEV